MNHKRLSQSDHTLLGTRNGALEHYEIVFHDTVVREATHRRDRLLSSIGFGRRVVLIITLANAVDLLVELCAVVVSVCDTTLDGIIKRLVIGIL